MGKAEDKHVHEARMPGLDKKQWASGVGTRAIMPLPIKTEDSFLHGKFRDIAFYWF